MAGGVGIASVLLHPKYYADLHGIDEGAERGINMRRRAIEDENFTKLSSSVAYIKVHLLGSLSSFAFPSRIRIGMPFHGFELPSSILSEQFSASKADSFMER